jgi:hypothetical protein
MSWIWKEDITIPMNDMIYPSKPEGCTAPSFRTKEMLKL